MCDNVENPIENFKFSLLCLFLYSLQIIQGPLKMSSLAELTRMSGDGRRLLSDKVRSENSNNSQTWYYDLSMELCLEGCYS